eukprot:2525141-Prymnesium_polylepis.1
MVANVKDTESATYQAYFARRRQLPPTMGDGVSCNLQTDDEGQTFLYAQDHDNDPGTPIVCSGHHPILEGPADSSGYDAVMAVAHALHELIEVRQRTTIAGSELLDTLIKQVSFDGASGYLEFNDASTDPDRLYHGDRR